MERGKSLMMKVIQNTKANGKKYDYVGSNI